uniref:Dehydrogenase/reductase 7 n=1 Tax=Saimiri boliviensis boliviensis TaxID=39432 RepID=A0A2K6SL33_SAIBB
LKKSPMLGGAGRARLLLLAVRLPRSLRADGDLRLLWAEGQGRRPERWLTDTAVGIGEELAYQLSQLGVFLVLSARRVHELERVKRRCLENSNLKEKDILVLPLDLTDTGSHEAATKAVLQEFGRIDILVNNGGVSQRSLCMDTKLNYLGTVSLTKCVSWLHLFPVDCASEHALRGIIASNICPGPVQSNIAANSLAGEVTETIGNGDQSYKMATSRCMWLMLISMANDVKEVWISEHPFLAWWITNKMGKKRFENFKSGVDADSSYFNILKRKHD